MECGALGVEGGVRCILRRGVHAAVRKEDDHKGHHDDTQDKEDGPAVRLTDIEEVR